MDHAKIARTLAASRTPGTARVAWNQSLFRVRHALDREARPLLLCRTGGSLDQALAEGDVAVVITVSGPAAGNAVGELPQQIATPRPVTPTGRVWISGWSEALDGLAARAAALEFALANPVSDLLDVGRGFCLHRIDVAEVRLELSSALIDVDVDDYVSAVSEPVM
jgi:hypothetical protein